jgi:GGDEF domain-containing protein
MGFWAFRDKVLNAPPSPSVALALPEHVQAALPPSFEAVGEALAAGRSATDACEVVGRLLSSQGVSLAETLADLRTTYELVLGAEPAYTDACAVALGWSESTLGYLHQLSCADPLTGLASMAHLRGRLMEMYRGDAHGPVLRDSYALVVVEGSSRRLAGLTDEVFGADLRMSRIGESVRSVFSGDETICRIGPRRIVVLASRNEALSRRTTLLRRLLEVGEVSQGGVRIWVESLPVTNESVASLLDELSRDQTS